jgi:hypothetical protein
MHEVSGAVPLLWVEAGQGAFDNFFIVLLEYLCKME